MKIALTLGSAEIISNAFFTVSGVAPLLKLNKIPTSAKITCYAPSDVKEVGGVATVQGKDIHGGHGQTRTVDKASDGTVKLDEVEVSLLGLNFRLLFLGDITEVEDVLLTELSVVIEAKLRVHAKTTVNRETS